MAGLWRLLLLVCQAIPVALSQHGSLELMSEEQDEASMKISAGEIETDDGVASLDDLTDEQLTKIHSEIDANHDGMISLVETLKHADSVRRSAANQELNSILEAHDRDGDKKLSHEEFLGEIGEMAGNMEEYEVVKQEKEQKFKDIDLDEDGFLDRDELPLVYMHHTNDKVENLLASQELKRLDKDGDGVLSPSEFWSNSYAEDHDGSITTEEQQQFEGLDANSDGSLSVAELKRWESGSYQSEEAMKALFDVADTDHDGLLTSEELINARGKIKDNHDMHSHIISFHRGKEL
jgi:Ca2+-binding EF-hand superfamily protein